MRLPGGQKNVSRNAPKHVVTRHGQKHTHESNAKNHHRNNVGQKKIQKKKQMKKSWKFQVYFLPSGNGRRSVTSFPPTSFLHTMKNAIR